MEIAFSECVMSYFTKHVSYAEHVFLVPASLYTLANDDLCKKVIFKERNMTTDWLKHIESFILYRAISWKNFLPHSSSYLSERLNTQNTEEALWMHLAHMCILILQHNVQDMKLFATEVGLRSSLEVTPWKMTTVWAYLSSHPGSLLKSEYLGLKTIS